ncbi:MAG: Hsp70 family protein [Polyangiales bacterium]
MTADASGRTSPTFASACEARFDDRRFGSARWNRVKKALADAGKTAADISEVVLVGGSMQAFLVQETVKKFSVRNRIAASTDEVVALCGGSSGCLSGEVEDMVLLDVTPLSLGVETGGVMTVLIPQHDDSVSQRRNVFDRGRQPKQG